MSSAGGSIYPPPKYNLLLALAVNPKVYSAYPSEDGAKLARAGDPSFEIWSTWVTYLRGVNYVALRLEPRQRPGIFHNANLMRF